MTGRVELPEAFEPLITVSARYKGYYSGRGCAKTHSFAQAAILLAAKKGWLFLCCREHQNSIRDSVKRVLDAKIVASGLSQFFHSTQNEIGAKSGGGFIFEGLRANVQGIRSKEGVHAAWVEEAATVSQSSLNILIPTIRKPRSELWFSWNPRHATDPVDKMLRTPPTAELAEFDKELATSSGYDQWQIVQRVHATDNPFFPDPLRAEMERDKRRDPDRYAHIWLGEYARDSEARVFRNWTIGVVDIPVGERPFYGADWGFSIDPTVLVRCYIDPTKRLLYIEAEVAGVGVDIDKTPALFDSIADGPDDPLSPRIWPITADSSRPETISYMMQHGFPRIEYARKGPGSVEEGIEFLKAYDIVVHPNCKRVIDELSLYSYETDKLTEEVMPKLADKDNHTIDALRYAIEPVRRNMIITGFPEVVTRPRTYFGDPGAQGMNDPTLSPGRSQGTEKGVVW
jgi:phage terminase large subunit